MEAFEGERTQLDGIVFRIDHLREFLAERPTPPADSSGAVWLAFLGEMKQIVGNASNDLSFVATLLAKDYLCRRFEMQPFDASAKPQGANGLDIDERTITGERVVGEIKTTTPYLGDRLGAAQLASFTKDFEKLRLVDAPHKFFFVTDPATFDLACSMLSERLPDVQVVLLGHDEPPA